MPIQVDISEETLKDILKAICVAVVTLSIKHLYSGVKKFHAYYEREKDKEYTMTFKKGTLIKWALFFVASEIVVSSVVAISTYYLIK